MRKQIIIVVAFFMAICLFNPRVGFSTEQIIKIGGLVPLTGAFAAEGKKMVDGMKFAVMEQNQAGGLLGKKLDLVVYDVGPFKAELIISGAKKLVEQDKVAAVFTGFLGGVVDIQTFAQYNIPYINSDTSIKAADYIWKNQVWNIFQVNPEETQLYRNQVYDLIINTPWKKPNKKIALLTMDRAYNKLILDANLESLEKEINKIDPGWEVVLNEVFPTATSEFGPVLSKIRNLNPSVIWFNDHVVSDEAAFVKQFMINPTNSLLGINYGPQNPEFLDLAGKAAEGVLWSGAAMRPTNTQAGRKYAEGLLKVTGEKTPVPSAQSVFNWYHIKIWIESVKSVGDERKYYEICKYIKGKVWQFPEVIAITVFDLHTNTGLTGHALAPCLLHQVQDMKNVVIAPSQHAEVKFRVPPWLK